MSFLFHCLKNDFRWVFTRVYGPTVGFDRTEFFDELESEAFRWEAPWCIGGDFNIVRFLMRRWENMVGLVL